MAALDALPDDALLSIITACTDVLLRHTAVPKLEAVCGLGRLCKDLRRQLYRLRPLVGVHVRSLTVAQRLRRWRSTRGPWEVVFLHMGDATAVVVEQAQALQLATRPTRSRWSKTRLWRRQRKLLNG